MQHTQIDPMEALLDKAQSVFADFRKTHNIETKDPPSGYLLVMERIGKQRCKGAVISLPQDAVHGNVLIANAQLNMAAAMKQILHLYTNTNYTTLDLNEQPNQMGGIRTEEYLIGFGGLLYKQNHDFVMYATEAFEYFYGPTITACRINKEGIDAEVKAYEKFKYARN